MKVLMISKACVTATYRTKLQYMATLPEGVDLTLVVPERWDKLPFEPVANAAYRVVHLPIRLNGHNHWHWYVGLDKVFREVLPDLVHIDEEHYSAVTYQATRLAKRYGVPSLFFTWQNLFKRYPWPFSGMERFVFANTKGAIAGNHEAEAVLRAKGYGRPITVIPQFGTDPEVFKPSPERALRKDWGLHEKTVVGYVGRLIPEKGLDVLQDAITPLLKAHPQLTLLLVGSGPWSKTAAEWKAQENLQTQVMEVPWLPSHRMPELMNALDVLVLPSLTTTRWKEQFGRVLPEAMACETAVIGSDSGEIPNVIGDAGLVVPEGDSTALRHALEHVATNPDVRARLGEAARRRVIDHFTQQAVAEETLAFYRQLG